MKKLRIFLLLVLLVIPVLVGCSENKVSITLDGTEIYSDFEGMKLWQTSSEKKTATLKIKNTTDRDVDIIIFTDSTEGYTVFNCKAGEKRSATVEMNSTNSAVSGISIDGVAYILTPKALDDAIEMCDKIVLYQNIKIDTLTITKPISLSTGKHSLEVENEVFVTTESIGDVSLMGNISAKGLYVNAPRCDVTVTESLIPKNITLSVVAKTFMGKAAPEIRIINSLDELLLMCNTEGFPYFHSGDTVVLEGFTIPENESIIIPCPLSITAKDMEFNGSITIKTKEKGNILLTDFPKDSIKIDSPNCNLVWNEANYSIFEENKNIKAGSVNKVSAADYPLGGKKEASLNITLAKGEGIYSDIKWERTSKYTYTATMTDPMAPSALKNAVLEVSDGTKTLKWSADKYCKESKGVNLLCSMGTSIVVNGCRYRLITKSACRLPVVEINTEDSAPITSKEEYLKAKIEIETSFATDYPPLKSTEIEISGRGNSTWKWSDKKPYKLKFNKKTSVLGLPKAENWTLLANYSDKTLIRNYVALEAAKVMDATEAYATQYPVDVYVNGSYVGVYTMGEKVEKGDERIKIKENGTTVDCGYLIELNGNDDTDTEWDRFVIPTLSKATIVSPNYRRIGEKEHSYISNYLSNTDRAITKNKEPEKYIDFTSLADWLITIEFTYSSDGCFRRSVFMVKDSGGLIRMVQPWDFDLALGNSYADGSYTEWASLADHIEYVNSSWSTALFRNKDFMEIMKDRWAEKKDELLKVSLDACDKGIEAVGPSAKANFEIWDIMYMRVGMEPFSTEERHTYKEHTDYLRNFITDRWEWIDSQLAK